MDSVYFVLRALVFISVLILIASPMTKIESAGQSSENFYVPKDVISMGGAEKSSSSFMVADTVGQSSAIGVSDSPSFLVYGGFWGPAGMVIPTVFPTKTPTQTPTDIPPTETPTKTPTEIPPTETPTSTPTGLTPSPTRTPVLAEVPAVGSTGLALLLLTLSGFVYFTTRFKKSNK